MHTRRTGADDAAASKLAHATGDAITAATAATTEATAATSAATTATTSVAPSKAALQNADERAR
jgi:hypothetical protein